MRQLYFQHEKMDGEALFESVEFFEKKKDWMGAVQVLDQLLQSPRYAKSLIFEKDGVQFSLRERARSRLLSLPQVALDHYSRLRRVDARLLFQRSGEDGAALQKIVESYPVPLYLAKASLRLAAMSFEEGRIHQVQSLLSHSFRWKHWLSSEERKRLRRLRQLCDRVPSEEQEMRSLGKRNYLIVGPVAVHWKAGAKPRTALLEARSLTSGKTLWRRGMTAQFNTKILLSGSTLFAVNRWGVQSLNGKDGKSNWALRWNQASAELGGPVQFISPDIHCVDNRLIIPLVSLNQQALGFYQYMVLALNLETGQLAWKKRLGTMKGSAPCQLSMTVKGQFLYLLSDDGLAFSIQSETGGIRWRRRYLTLASFNRRVHHKHRILAQVAPNLRALQSRGDSLYFYNAALHALIVLEQDGGKLVFDQSLAVGREIASFSGRYLVYKGYEDRSSGSRLADLSLCFCQRKHPGPCLQRGQKNSKKSGKCTMARGSP